MDCTLARSLDVIGEWWTLLVVRDAFLGVTRFDDFQERLGIARNVLTARLETLVANGVLERRVYDEARDRADYKLTDKGRALWPVITTLREWGDEWIAGRGNEPVDLVHHSCGRVTHPQLVCDQCGETLGPRDVRPTPGPGLSDLSLLDHVKDYGTKPARG